MRRLMLLRHAKTERAAPSERDYDRKLMKRGRADAPAIGAYMAHHGLGPDLALVSPAVRAQETWTLVAAAFGIYFASLGKRFGPSLPSVASSQFVIKLDWPASR